MNMLVEREREIKKREREKNQEGDRERQTETETPFKVLTKTYFKKMSSSVVGVWGKEPDVEVDLLLSFFVQEKNIFLL